MSIEKSQSFLADWDIVRMSEATKVAHLAANSTQLITNTFFSKIEKIMNKAFHKPSINNEEVKKACPLGEKQFSSYLDFEGKIKSMRELRLSSYRRGVMPKLRKAVWKHLLNVFPLGLTGQQRFEYVKAKSVLYNQLKSVWQANLSDPQVDYIYHMVKKDVLRTDRYHSFYASSGDKNPNVIALLNILTTFALNHRVKYCQGMSDLASPLLYAMKEESHAYMCFCALMNRLSENFSSDGEAITQKFENLSILLQYYDPDFYLYLKQNGVQDLLFCYRWIMLELKREFAFDDTLYMLEVLWSSIPPIPIDDLSLFDSDYRFIAGQYSLKSNLEFYLTSKPTCSTQDSANCITNSNHNFNHCHTPKMNRTNSYLHPKDLSHTHPFKFQCGDLEDSGSIKLRKEDKKSKTRYFVRPSSGNYYTPLHNSLPNSHHASRPRTLRFLPKLLSNDSHEIDSPEAEAYQQPFSFPPSLIDKQFSIENDYCVQNRDATDTKLTQRLESINGSKVREKKSKLSRQSNFDHGNDLNRLDVLVHCNGEYSDMIIDTSKDWSIPRALVRNESLDSFKNLQIETNETMINTHIDHSQRFEKEKSEGYESGSTSEAHFDSNDNKSLSSSCSSMVILSNEALPDSNKVATLPSPVQLGYNNAFMLFLCLTLLLQHRDKIMSSKMDSNEIGIYFDSYIRRHDVHNVLNYARQLFYSYLSHWHQNTSDDELQTFYNSLDLV